MKRHILLIIVFLMTGCIGQDIIEDFVEARLDILNPIQELEVGTTHQLMFRYLNNVGVEEMANVVWTSSSPMTISVSQDGLLSAIETGFAVIQVSLSTDNQVMAELVVEAGEETIMVMTDGKGGTIETTSSYVLEGDFTIADRESGGVVVDIDDNYRASSALPGLYVYLSNNPSTTTGAYEIGAVDVFSGAHQYTINDSDINVSTYQYLLYFCKPFNVKVGHGEIMDQ